LASLRELDGGLDPYLISGKPRPKDPDGGFFAPLTKKQQQALSSLRSSSGGGGGGGNEGTTATSTGGVSQTFTYPTTLPALTPQQQEALMTRRRLATRGFEETQNVVQREQARAEADTLRQRQEIAREQQLQSRAGMQTLAGRGVARSPMFVNPFQRQLAEGAQRQIGELQSGLGATLASLESALRQAEIGRERELAQIDFDAGSFRSDIDRLLGA
jgi:hypothetical protein